MDEKLEIIIKRSVPATDEDATELRRIKEERLSTQKCLEICAQLSDHIKKIQVTPKQNTSPPESTELGAVAVLKRSSMKACKGVRAASIRHRQGWIGT